MGGATRTPSDPPPRPEVQSRPPTTNKETPMSMQLVALVGVLILGLAAIALVYLLGMRSKSPLVLGPLIRLQRVIINPRQMRSAGTPGAYAAVIRHRGRTSGLPYETPVGVVATDDGFLIALVYGSRTNWLRNVLAAGCRDHRPRRVYVHGRRAGGRPDAGGGNTLHGRRSARIPLARGRQGTPGPPGGVGTGRRAVHRCESSRARG